MDSGFMEETGRRNSCKKKHTGHSSVTTVWPPAFRSKFTSWAISVKMGEEGEHRVDVHLVWRQTQETWKSSLMTLCVTTGKDRNHEDIARPKTDTATYRAKILDWIRQVCKKKYMFLWVWSVQLPLPLRFRLQVLWSVEERRRETRPNPGAKRSKTGVKEGGGCRGRREV